MKSMLNHIWITKQLIPNQTIENHKDEELRKSKLTFQPSFCRIECSSIIIKKLCTRSSTSPIVAPDESFVAPSYMKVQNIKTKLRYL